MNHIDITKLDLNLLKSFQALIAERHVGRAAKKMNVTQPAMSHTLSRLRKSFDDELFIRSGRGMEPNARALQLSEKVTQILDEIGTLFEAEEFDPAAINIRFRIQTHGYIATAYLPALISRIRCISPGIIFDLKSITPSCYQHLERNLSDLIIGAGIGASQEFRQALFIEDGLCCLVDKRHPALQEWTPANVINYPHIKLTLLEDRHDPVTMYYRKNGYGERQIGLYTESLNMQPSFLPDTNLIAFIPATLAQQAVTKNNSLKAMPCPFNLPELSVKGIWHERSENDTVHTWIRSELLQANQ